jgi:hypothetical protein
MGFRSTICSEHYSGNLPDWFKEKYKQTHLFPDGLLVVSKTECKYYTNVFFDDYQKAVKESGFWDDSDLKISIVVLAEDGFISKVVICKNRIKYYWLYSGEEDENENDSVWMRG